MELRAGYKQTEVGVIPDAWEVRSFDQVAMLERGKFSARPRNDPKFFGGSYPFIQTGDVSNSQGDIQTYSQTLNEAGLKVSKLFPKDTLFFTIAANIGDVGFASFDTACPDSLIGITPNNRVNRHWLYHELKSRKSSFESLATQNAQLNINLEKLRPYLLPIPPILEQRAIATALSDVDALLAKIDQLIAKKRDLKQAAMQQLLTGKTRLPGFSGEWQVKRLGDVVEIKKGQLITEKTVVFGDIPVIAGGKRPAYFHNEPNRTGKTITVSASGASAGYVALFESPIFASDCSTISESEHYSIEFIFFQLQLSQDTIYRAQTGGAQPHIHAVDLAPIKIGYPGLEEQTAIATVLSDMDSELAALQARRDKTRALKQGMMQALLTGKIRLK